MNRYTPIGLLHDGDAAATVAPDCEGRVITSTFDRQTGPSFGWINRPVIESGFRSEVERNGKPNLAVRDVPNPALCEKLLHYKQLPNPNVELDTP